MLKYFSLVVSVILITGCTAAPIQEMSDARQAIRAATKATAVKNTDKNSVIVLEKARRYLVVAENALERGEYSQAKRSALKAKQHAVKARLISINSP